MSPAVEYICNLDKNVSQPKKPRTHVWCKETSPHECHHLSIMACIYFCRNKSAVTCSLDIDLLFTLDFLFYYWVYPKREKRGRQCVYQCIGLLRTLTASMKIDEEVRALSQCLQYWSGRSKKPLLFWKYPTSHKNIEGELFGSTQ